MCISMRLCAGTAALILQARLLRSRSLAAFAVTFPANFREQTEAKR
jgi:hypothetical protein